MAKQIQLTIPEPCHENWNAMSPVEKGRFCNACQKQVVDFTRMGDAQLAAFFKKPSTGSVCGRFIPDQLDRDIEIPRKRVPWVKYFFQFAIPAFLALSKAYTQGGVILKKEQLTVCMPDKPADSIAYPQENKLTAVDLPVPVMGGIKRPPGFLIKGKVVDESGNPIPHASVIFKGTKVGTATDSNGHFTLRSNSTRAELTVSSIGYRPMEKRISLKKNRKPVTLRLAVREVMGAVSFLRPKSTSQLKTPSLLKSISDTVLKKFKLFPNPVKAGADLNIQCDRMEEGYYSLQLLTLSGDVVFRKEIWIDDKARLINLPVPAVAAGAYLFRMASNESGWSSTQKKIIQ